LVAPLTTTWTPEKKREYARERYKRLKGLRPEKNSKEKTKIIQDSQAGNTVAKEELRRMAKWLLLEARKS
jgi:hypothetical protein